MKYIKNILWCPIDIPKFPSLSQPLIAKSEWSSWKFKKLTNKKNTAYEITDFTTEAYEKIPELIDWVNLFPYKSIRNIKINFQIDSVPQHVDFTRADDDLELYKNNIHNEPCGYRVLISGKRSNSLYIEHKGKKVYPVLPEETDTYVLGHTNMPHGVEYEPGRNTMFMHFEIDATKHLEMLSRSYKKYKDYAIVDT